MENGDTIVTLLWPHKKDAREKSGVGVFPCFILVPEIS